MWFDGRRQKKLIVAFHFQFANQAAWDCDNCRSRGLVDKRNCGFAPQTTSRPNTPVWVRRNVVATECPKSMITTDSRILLEQFGAWKTFGCADANEMNARTAEAFVILDREWELERRHLEDNQGAR